MRIKKLIRGISVLWMIAGMLFSAVQTTTATAQEEKKPETSTIADLVGMQQL